SDVGGVALGLSDRAAVAEACRRIEANVRASAPEVALDGFLIQRQARGALELALGVKVDPVFGPVVLVGSGGVLIEVLRDFRLLLPPIDAVAAEEALRGLRISPLWDGVRGGAPLDLPAAVELLQRLGDAARSLGAVVSEIDLNPVLVGRRGEGVTILDALVRR
ncbi:MAG TPA: acetate--CoA ligase family protein, partial [Candidatus Udaeobacter sp.]|nr:acetate--CoA ligase family protein [Candidatus Udaeobacter sp.]